MKADRQCSMGDERLRHSSSMTRELMGEEIFPPQSNPASRFEEDKGLHFGPLTAIFISITERSARRIIALDSTHRNVSYHLIHVRRGMYCVDLPGRLVKVAQGQSILVESPTFHGQVPAGGVDALVLEMRRDWLQGWLPAPELAVGQVFGGLSNWGGDSVVRSRQHHAAERQ